MAAFNFEDFADSIGHNLNSFRKPPGAFGQVSIKAHRDDAQKKSAQCSNGEAWGLANEQLVIF
jgi:hypothetical protein